MEETASSYLLDDEIELELEDEYVTEIIDRKLKDGSYEVALRKMIKKYLPKYSDLPVIEIGSGMGATTSTIANSTDSRVVAVEAHPEVKHILRRTRELNDLDFSILSKAYDPRATEKVSFRVGTENIGFIESSVMDEHEIDHSEEIEVMTTTLYHIRSHFEIDDFALVMNAEGAERLLVQEPDQLQHCPLIIVEVHATERDVHTADYSWFLDEMGDSFECTEVADGDHNITVVFEQK